MKEIIKSSSTRIKTGVILILAVLLIGYIDSFFIMWLLFGGLLVIGISESKNYIKQVLTRFIFILEFYGSLHIFIQILKI